jgi:hypothetical protein
MVHKKKHVDPQPEPVDPRHEKIAVAAYYLWEADPENDAVTNWLEAEAQLQTDGELMSSSEYEVSPSDHSR